eukprot:TRINITY_DN21191_c1_g2_i1.p1 TRINITY_DN21191_c1_g2~~TRINITY_DN21191_c1_g2_i1.p1  ORF type:complete len:195 (-),score=25.72 TRINITY_DN21191_c1_g2_i1:228-812(-)
MPWDFASVKADMLRTPELLRNTKLCKFYLNGACLRGEACTYAHSGQELQKQPDLFKTSLCEMFQTSGKCRRGSRCKFAHFPQDLRTITQTDKARHRGFEAMSSSSMGKRNAASTYYSSQFMAAGYPPFKLSQGQTAEGNYDWPVVDDADSLPNQTHEMLRADASKSRMPREYNICPKAGYPGVHEETIVESIHL